MSNYDHKKIEPEMRALWEKEGLYRTPDKPRRGKGRYVLDMFPYPSGAGLHVGHVEGYTATDIYARFLRMNDCDVLHPMGWDAFGLPAENHAVKTGVHPSITTGRAIETFRSQMRSLGLSYDWSRELNTSTPDYYRWTQWLFLLLYKNGLAYKKKAAVNWCPSCQTVLANEQVVEGACERCDTNVEKRELEQWFLNITRYADELVNGLDTVDWPESTKLAQKNWIGKSEGAEFSFPVDRTFTYVLLHGYKSGPEKHFHPWLKSELEARGHTVVMPKLPNPDKPNIDEQVDYVLNSVVLDENTVLIGHSLGSVVAMKVLEKVNVTIHKLVLVAGFLDTNINVDRGYFGTTRWDIDTEKIKNSARRVVILRPENDSVIPHEQATKLRRALGGEIVDFLAEDDHARGKREQSILEHSLEHILVFTTRPDTLFGATYLVLAPEHPLIEAYADAIKNIKDVRAYVHAAKNKTDIERGAEGKEKTGIQLEGLFATHPGTQERIPIYVADYIVGGYGSGAIMAVPAHDSRDFDFAKTFGLPIREVISGEGELPRSTLGTLVNSGEFSGLDFEEAGEAITRALGRRKKVTYRLRDWLVSRQRYWGAPIPIVYDPEGSPHPIPEEHLPWTLPSDVEFLPKGTSPLGSSKELFERTEKLFGKGWTPEIDTLDTFVDSAWYFFRFTDPKNENIFAEKEAMKAWMPVTLYVGGAEHTVLHLLYSRFFTKVLRDLGYVEIDEPFSSLRHPGMVLGPDGEKMSKSRGNVVNPDEMIERFGADTLRIYEMFMGPFHHTKSWSTDNMIGVRRFLEKVWRIRERVQDSAKEDKKLRAETIKKVTRDIETFEFNTVVSQLMIYVNALEKQESVAKGDFSALLLLLAPLAPHLADALWRELGNADSIHKVAWPTYDENDLVKSEVVYAVQVGGKVRDTITLPVDLVEEDIVLRARTKKVEKWLAGKAIKKTVVVKGKIVNFVVQGKI
jgi:leucyl-tRNA synthetase